MNQNSEISVDRVGTEAPVAMRMRDVVKTFPGVRALKSVSFEALAGEVHALVGENGAGKSTLMGVASGDLVPDSGLVEYGGFAVREFNPSVSRDHGIAIVHQHPALVPDLTVSENILLALPTDLRPTYRDADEWVRTHLQYWQVEIDPGERIEDISLANQHLIEIVKALALNPKVLILDEPTEHMVAEEVQLLFDRIRKIIAEGRTVVYISHRIHEVKAVADRVTVLRDGEIRGTFDAETVTESEIVNLVVGRQLDAAFPPKPETIDRTGTPNLEVAGLKGGAFVDVSLTAYPGEIIGLAGIEGNGQRAFLRGLAGFDVEGGHVRIGGKDARVTSTVEARKSGIAYIPRERHAEALFSGMSVFDNIGLMALGRHAKGGLMQPKRETEAISSMSRALSVKTPTLEMQVNSLSGGNQQKSVIARCLLDEPALLLADEPSQGVDAGARLEIYRILRKAATEGRAVIVASSDAIELQGLCDRVFIFSRGSIVKELAGEEVTERNITQATLTATTERARTGEGRQRRTLWQRALKSDLMPGLVLIFAMVVLGAYTNSVNESYLTGRNFSNVLLLLTALGFIALGQLTVLLTAGIDLAVGPLSGLVVVVASFFVLDDVGTGMLLIGFILSLGAALLTGFFNYTLIRGLLITPVIATLATYMGIRGLSLLLREVPGGLINYDVTEWLSTRVGFMPLAFLVLVATALFMEFVLRRTRLGLSLRAVGSDEANARKIGVKTERTFFFAYMICAALTWCGGIMLMAQIGVGDPTAGVTYTLMGITAVVLGGASLFGGRGSYVGVLLGAILVQQIFNVTTFLRLTDAWQFWLLGILTIGAAAFYSHLRRIR
ncbi:MAG: ATP-binding cassette domain-containing protein [Roseovarius sp.]|nr:ATP-binding cassette domain-containing protein [Roseovarius sp.]